MTLTVGLLGTADLSVFDAPMASAAALSTPSDDVPDAPSGTVSEFFPESANLSDCVGLVEQPGCGSEARGGWHKTAVFVALFAGLGVILWRVSRGISSNRRAIDAGIHADSDPT